MQHFIALAIGILLILFRDKVANLAIQSQNKTWGFKFGSKEIQAAKIAAVGVGLFLILGALFSILGLKR
jgi:hypothetical protein